MSRQVLFCKIFQESMTTRNLEFEYVDLFEDKPVGWIKGKLFF